VEEGKLPAAAPGVLAHPSADTESLLDILQETGAHDKVVAMRASSIGALASRPSALDRDVSSACLTWRGTGSTRCTS